MTHIATTNSGRLEGHEADGVIRFLGIRYGAPTGGANRFLPPQPVTPWTGVRAADTLGPIAPQFSSPRRPSSSEPSEDCLALNVWTAGLNGSRPVIVWIHGGGFATGSGYSPQTDGAALAQREDVVVVSINHRLSLPGFLYLGELGGEDWGHEANPGLLDLVAALRWVRENIHAFGGDPSRVLIKGHSGGGGKVGSLLSSPPARGLFSRAALHGGPPFGLKDRGRATVTAQRVLEVLGLRSADRQRLQELPLERIMDAQSQLGVGSEPTEHGMRFAPVVGTPSLPAMPQDAFGAGVNADVPLLTGTSVDEMRYVYNARPHWLDPAFDLDGATLERLVAAGVDNAADAGLLLDRYRADYDAGRNVDLLTDILSDQFLERTARLADARARSGTAPVFSYLCTLNHSRPNGTFHGVQMPLFFGNVGRGPAGLTGPAYDAASDVLRRMLAAFAATGDPNDAGVAGIEWPAYDPAEPLQLVFGDAGFDVTDAWLAERRPRWAGITATAFTDPWGRAFEAASRTQAPEEVTVA